jgi:hypothetical protein
VKNRALSLGAMYYFTKVLAELTCPWEAMKPYYIAFGKNYLPYPML